MKRSTQLVSSASGGAGSDPASAAAPQDCVSCGLLFIDASDNAMALNGEAAQVLTGKALYERVPLAHLPAPLANLVSEVRATRQPVLQRTLLQGCGAMPLPVGLAGALADPAGQSVVVAVNRFSPVVPLEPDLQQLDRLASLGTLSAELAHEIKNALVAVRTFTDLLLEKNPDAELADLVRREMSRIDSTVGRLLKFARPSAATPSLVQIHGILDYAIRLVQPHMKGRTIGLDRSFQATADLVAGDESELHQAFLNLLMNGVEAMPPSGTLSVLTENAEAELGNGTRPALRIVIKDTGPGIPPENLARLFEPFFTTKPAGTGLGLAATRRIVAEHGGSISVDSRPSKGTSFVVTLPLSTNRTPQRLAAAG